MRKFLLFLFIWPVSVNANELADALQKARPGAEWVLEGDTYQGLTWMDKKQSKPSESELAPIVLDVRKEKLRKKEYPTLEEKIDAVIQGGQALIDIRKRISDVDAKYP